MTTSSANVFQRDSHHASHNFGQTNQNLWINHPRIAFEYFINIHLNNVTTATEFIAKYAPTEWSQVMPLVKTVEMPSMKIETTPLNQYNRKRLSQTKISFEPIKMVFHDVADGKTLQFWNLYYRYYFGDGNEPGVNMPKQEQGNNKQVSIQNADGSKDTIANDQPTGQDLPYNTNGNKQSTNNIIKDTLDSHIFGFNLPTVQNVRELIQSIDIYQVHGGCFNKVTLVNPRIAAFTHDTLSYAAGDKTLEMTFTFEYEYAYYTLDNERMSEEELSNFDFGDFLDIDGGSDQAASKTFLPTKSSQLDAGNNVFQRVGNNVQSTTGSVAKAYPINSQTRTGTSSLSGMIDVRPKPDMITESPAIQTRPFDFSGDKLDSNMYQDVNRTVV